MTDKLNFPEKVVRHLSGPLGPVAFVVLKLLGVEIPRTVRIGANLRLPHGAVGLVVHQYSIIGNDVRLYQGVTLGRADQRLPRSEILDDPEHNRGGGFIEVEDDVIVGANAVVLFKAGQTLTLGRGCTIGANSVVLHSVPRGETWAGAPAHRVKAANSR